MNKLWKFYLTISLFSLLLFCHNRLFADIHSPIISPFFIIAGEQRDVNISTYIPDTNLVENNVLVFQINTNNRGRQLLGRLNDDGENGDTQPGDRVYSSTLRFTENRTSVITLLIFAPRRGSGIPLTREVNIPVIHINSIQNTTQYSQTLEAIFLDLLDTQEIFLTLNSPSTSADQFINFLSIIKDNLLSVLSQLRAIDRFETNSPTNLPKLAAHLSVGSSLVEKSDEVLNEKTIFIENGSDPRVAHIAQWAITSGCLDPSDLSGASSSGLRKVCAYEYDIHNPASAYNSELLPKAGQVIIKQTTGQYSNLIGQAIGSLFNRFGFFISRGVNAAIGKFLDILIAEETNAMVLIIGEVQNDEPVQIPAGEHEIVFTFQGSQERAIVRNVQVDNNSSFTFNLSPGQIIDNPPSEPEAGIWNEDFEGTVPIVMDASTCHQDPEQYGYMSHASIVSGVAVSPTHSLRVRFEDATTGGFCFGGFLGHLDTISAYVRISGATTNSQLVLVSQGAAAPPRGCMVRFNSGSVDAYTADFQHVQQLGAYNTDTFYKIVFVVDLDNQSCRISWADGALSNPVASDTQGAFHHWSQLFMVTSGAGVTMHIDDIARNH